MITFDDVAQDDKKIILYKHKASWSEEIPVIHKADGVPLNYDSCAEPLKLECQSFINWIDKDILPPSNVDEGLRVLKVLNLAEKSLKKENI